MSQMSLGVSAMVEAESSGVWTAFGATDYPSRLAFRPVEMTLGSKYLSVFVIPS